MTGNRYYKKDWEESYYIFDSKTLPESEFEERVEYEVYDVFGDSLTGSEIIDLLNENEQLKEHIKSLEKQLYLIHMQSMFSTVKSFKGDVSKRYKYSEETDTIYDTANKYGQLNKILDKKEITMLLNEYETILNGVED